jgi:hypothetical protein
MSAGGKVVSDDGFLLSRLTSDPFCMNGYEFATAQSRERGKSGFSKEPRPILAGHMDRQETQIPPTFGREKVPITGSFPTANNRMIDERSRTGPLTTTDRLLLYTVFLSHAS